MRNEEAGPGVVIPNRPTQRSKPTSPHSTAPQDRNASLQAAGQLRRAEGLEAQAAHRHAFGDWPGARRLLHEARQLRRLAAGPRPEAPLVDIERELAAGQLARWAGRRAA